MTGRHTPFPDGLKGSLSRKRTLLLFLAVLGLLAMLVGVCGFYVLRVGQRTISLSPSSLEIPADEGRLPSDAVPPFEVFSGEEAQETELGLLPDIHAPDRIPKVAILIDDLGYDRQRARDFAGLGVQLTFSILPHSPFQKEIAEAAISGGNEILLHLPMEPREYPKMDPGPGALLMAMTPEAFTRQILDNLESLPAVKGVNNHMGSRITADRDRMTILFSVLKERGLFFLDSRTTSRSAAETAAQKTHLDFTHRDVFLDHVPEPEFVEKQINRLMELARRQGTAIGIAHPNKATYRVFKARLPRLIKEVALVPVSAVLYQRLADANGLEMPASTLKVPDQDTGEGKTNP